MTHPTGEQYPISSGEHQAVITEVGATLRTYRVAGRDVVRGFGAEEVISGGRGQQLLPWPNRIRDGRYPFAGKTQQLALSEPARHNAIHGLVRHAVWTLVEHTDDTVRQRVRVYPQPGWPGVIEAISSYRVGPGGLAVEVQVTNIGATAVPFGYAAHPYLTVGEAAVDAVSVAVPAGRYLAVDERLLPVALVDVDGREQDLRHGRPLGSTTLDTAYTGLAADQDGRWHVRLSLADRVAELWGEPPLSWVQVFTGNDRRDLSIAVEPMTCGPDAFNDGPTHAEMIILEPAAVISCRWGITGR